MIIFVFNISLRFISRFGRFHEDFPLKEGTVRVPLPFSRNRPENHSHNLGKALGEGLDLLCAPFTLSIPFTFLSLSPFYPFHLSIPFTSVSLSPLYSFQLSNPFTSLSLSLSYLSLPLYISPSTFPSLSLLLSIILFGISNRRFRPCLILNIFAFIHYPSFWKFAQSLIKVKISKNY